MADRAHHPRPDNAEQKPETELPSQADDSGAEEIDETVDDEELDSLDDGMFDPMQQLTQLLVTEEGVPLVDVVQGIQDALVKQNKILYKLASVIEAKLDRTGDA